MPDAIYDAAVTDSAEIQPATATTWRKWLLRNHDSAEGVWVITYRKHTGQKTPTYEELVVEALCFGWIDSKPGAVDADRTKLYFTPRRKGSGWAATNKARVARLIAEGRMQPAGLAAIERAKEDGSWTKLDGSDSLDVPTDLEAEFAAFLAARGTLRLSRRVPAGRSCSGSRRRSGRRRVLIGSRKPPNSPRRMCEPMCGPSRNRDQNQTANSVRARARRSLWLVPWSVRVTCETSKLSVDDKEEE